MFKTNAFQILFALLIMVFVTRFVSAQTLFTYQGKLSDNGNPASGNYDFQFTLWDALNGGTQQPQPSPITVTRNNVSVAAGIFTVQLDFTVNAFPGADRFLEIGVRHAGVGSFTILTPRQQISSTPYAIRTLSAMTADNAAQLGGVPANQYVQTNDARLSDARTPTPGSSDYIQSNPANPPQSGANFNISGNGAAAGSLSGNVVNATTQYNIGGNRILSAPGTNNLFAGFSAGQAITAGQRNVFVGPGAGQANDVATANSFFGYQAGQATSSGGSNSFFGDSAGRSNTTGVINSFFGADAGLSNTSGRDNSFFGGLAGRNSTGNANSFFGSSAGLLNTTGSSNSFFGYQAGLANTSGNKNAFFGSGAGSSASTDFQNSFFGYHAGTANNGGTNNSFFGSEAGSQTTTGAANSFFGGGAGLLNVSGSDNSFFGNAAGFRTTSDRNSFFGSSAGATNNSGSDNAFFGYQAGVFNTGFHNSFFGSGAGQNNTSASFNSLFGYQAGGNTTGHDNSFFGDQSGYQTIDGSNNSFFGVGAGQNNTTGSFNTAIGFFAGAGSGNLDHATVIGAGAVVSSSNTIMLGRGFVDNVVVGRALTVQVIPDGGSFSNQVCFDAPGNLLHCTSSLRYKTNVRSFAEGLNTLLKLRPISFNWKESGEEDVGLGAEDVAKVAPLFVSTNTKGEISSVKYAGLSALFINAIKEQQQQIEKQNSLILRLQQQIKALRSNRHGRRKSASNGGL